jgi:hypothetical protein
VIAHQSAGIAARSARFAQSTAPDQSPAQDFRGAERFARRARTFVHLTIRCGTPHHGHSCRRPVREIPSLVSPVALTVQRRRTQRSVYRAASRDQSPGCEHLASPDRALCAPHLTALCLHPARKSAKHSSRRADLRPKVADRRSVSAEYEGAFTRPIMYPSRTAVVADVHSPPTSRLLVHDLTLIRPDSRPIAPHAVVHRPRSSRPFASPVAAMRSARETRRRLTSVVPPAFPSRVDPRPSSRSHHAASKVARSVDRPITCSRVTRPQPFGGPATMAL